MLIPLDYDTYRVMKMNVIVYVNKDNKQCINDIFLLIRKVDGINTCNRYEKYNEKPSE